MARRREEREGFPWLYHLETDPPDGLLPGGVPPFLSENEAMHTLNRDYDLILEVSEYGGIFSVVCRPLRRNPDPMKPKVAASYTGVNLVRILNQAVCDYEDMVEGPDTWETKSREYVRRVASGAGGRAIGSDSGGPVAVRAGDGRTSAARRGKHAASRIDSHQP